MNRRNAELLMELNRREYYPRVDDKAETKRICAANQIPTPATFAIVSRFGEIAHFERVLTARDEFVVKPARGAAGRGVMVIAGRSEDGFRTSSGQSVSAAEARYHLSCILSGLYSLGGRLDKAIVEQRLQAHSAFAGVCFGGTPDLRMIVHRNVPVMAMLRLPTALSRGRANLHQGAVGVGVDLQTGITRGGVHLGQPIRTAPDTGQPVAGLQIPFWPEILSIAERLSRALEMGYVGLDLVLDAQAGPVVLEANARPGLAIQVANHEGLLSAIESCHPQR
jgi:alpha-L-glutamate ligase-like protein